jgi:hypothetical protein
MEVSDQLYTPAALAPWKEPPVPTGLKVWCAPESVWVLWRREISLPPAGNQT